MKYFIVAALLISIFQSKIIPGGRYDPDSNDSGLALAIDFARKNFNSACKLPQYTWGTVISYQAQIVRGNNYFITAQVNKGSELKTIIVTVWVQPLDNQTGKIDISITNCQVK